MARGGVCRGYQYYDKVKLNVRTLVVGGMTSMGMAYSFARSVYNRGRSVRLESSSSVRNAQANHCLFLWGRLFGPQTCVWKIVTPSFHRDSDGHFIPAEE